MFEIDTTRHVGLLPLLPATGGDALETWRTVWREGFAGRFSDAGLLALADGLRRDDRRLLQGQTTEPQPLAKDWPVEGGCFVVYAGHVGEGIATVGECEEYFHRVCFDADRAIGEPAACRWLLNWFDDTPRQEVRRELLAEVELALAARGVPIPPPADDAPAPAMAAAF